MVFVNAITEIDKAGRIVVPKKMRDALHLVPGTRLTLKQNEDGILIAPEATGKRGLYFEDGMPVYYTGQNLAAEAFRWVEMARDERAEQVMGPWETE